MVHYTLSFFKKKVPWQFDCSCTMQSTIVRFLLYNATVAFDVFVCGLKHRRHCFASQKPSTLLTVSLPPDPGSAADSGLSQHWYRCQRPSLTALAAPPPPFLTLCRDALAWAPDGRKQSGLSVGLSCCAVSMYGTCGSPAGLQPAHHAQKKH